MHIARAQTRRRLLGFLCVLSAVSGCVVAPVPLVETTEQKFFIEPSEKHPGVEIEIETQTWYLPIVASAEGPAKMRSGNSRHTVYWVSTESKRRESLPFLQVATDNGLESPWEKFSAIEGAEWILAIRFAMDKAWDAEKRKEGVYFQRTKIELAVFTRSGLKHRRMIETVENEQSKKYRYNIKISKDGRTMDYFTPQGRRRYHVLDDREESVPDNTPLDQE